MKTKNENEKEIVISAWSILQYFQLPDKNSHDISTYIYHFFVVFQNLYVFIPLFLSKPQMVFCVTLRFRGTQIKKH